MKKIINLMASAMIAGAAITTIPVMAEPMDKYDETTEIQVVETINKTENILTLVLTAIEYPTDMNQWTTEQMGKWNDVYSAKYTKLLSMYDSGTGTEDEIFNTFVSIIDYSNDKNSWTADQKNKWDTVYNSIYNCLIKEIVTIITTSNISETVVQTTTTSTTAEIVMDTTETTTEIVETTVDLAEEITSINSTFETTTSNNSTSTSTNFSTGSTLNTYSTSNTAQITETSVTKENDSEKPPKTGDKQVKEWVITLCISIFLVGFCGIAGIVRNKNRNK